MFVCYRAKLKILSGQTLPRCIPFLTTKATDNRLTLGTLLDTRLDYV